MTLWFHQIIVTILIVFFLIKDSRDTFALNLDMLDKTLPHGLIANRSIAGNCTASTITNKDYLTIFLQCQSHGTILTTDDVYTILLLTAIVSIIGKDQASYTAKSGKSSGNADGQDAMSIDINYYGGTFTAIGGAKGPSGANDGKAISSSRNISNQTAGTITLEYSDDGQTWGGTFDINASTSSTPTYHAIRKTN